MNEKNLTDKIPRRRLQVTPSWVSALSNAALVVIGVVGTIFLVIELKQLTRAYHE